MKERTTTSESKHKRRKNNVPDMRNNEKRAPRPVSLLEEQVDIHRVSTPTDTVSHHADASKPRRVRRREESPWSNPLSCWEACCNFWRLDHSSRRSKRNNPFASKYEVCWSWWEERGEGARTSQGWGIMGGCQKVLPGPRNAGPWLIVPFELYVGKGNSMLPFRG